MENTITDESVRRVLRVHQKSWEAEGITSITLVDPSGRSLPTWQPGAHLSLHLPNGLVREYSLCSDPQDTRTWTVAVLRTADSRGGSSHIHDQLPVGALVEVEGPRNAFHLDEGSTYYLIAGGIGVTPIISMVRALQARGADWSVLYTGRSRAGMAFLEEFATLPRERVHIHINDEEGCLADIPGLVRAQDPRTLVYCCGPGPLMDAVSEAIEDPTRLRLERFKAPTPVVDPDAVESGFEVVVQSSGQQIPVGPEESVLEALEEAGVEVAKSCTEGICGTCETRVLCGEVDHRDFLLSPEEHEAQGTMMICVSRSRSPQLVLDL
ncbi:PDR/VanB family oxidoreductase [Kocuria sp. M1R5S2]|uniref:PDR/VanB family oxidoreductase n=1 Tax=Kocuria rhizosphaerae TaxID=3376285 RepID=UPI00378B7FF9